MANSAAILTDAWPAAKRGFALGTNQIAALSGPFVGLVAGGLLAAIDWRRCSGSTCRSACSARCGPTGGSRRWGSGIPRDGLVGNVTFALGLGAVLVGVTVGIQPYHGQAMGWTSPEVIGLLAGGGRCSPGSASSSAASPSRCSSSACSRSGRSRPAASPACSWPSPGAASSSC